MNFFYVILTCDDYQTTRCNWVRSTWLRYVKSYLFLSSTPNETDVVGWNTPDTYDGCPRKYIELFRNKTIDADWIVFVDDDTFVMPHRLESYLARLDASKPFYVGYTLDHEPSGPFMSGGAGFAITRSLYAQIQEHVRTHTNEELIVHTGSDVCIARWMKDPIFHDVRAMNPNLTQVNEGTCLTIHPCTEELFERYSKWLGIPIFVLSYNNPTHVKSMVEQVQRFTQNYYVVDNASTFGPMKEYLATIEPHVIRMDKNYGHSVYYQPQVWNRAGEKFIITDPDLWLNPNMPSNVVSILAELSDRYGVNKVGLALDITGSIRTDHRLESGESIVEWESQFWKKRVPHETYELYDAALDTTFCLFNKRIAGYSAIRIAGDFMCKHRPWYVGWENDLLPGELDAYRSGNVSSHYAMATGFTETARPKPMESKYYEPPGIEHYRLLEHFTTSFSDVTLIDIGTYTGLSAYALSTNPKNQVLLFDIETKPNLPVRPNIKYLMDNLMTPEGRKKWKDTLLAAPFMFLDIDPHEGTREYEFYEWLRDNDYKGFVICDDIWYFGGMQENFWSKIPDAHKINATYMGHWSGTGLIRFHPGKAEELLESFRDNDWAYGRRVLDMALLWHPSCEVAQKIRASFYSVIQTDPYSKVENYLTDGTPGYSLRLLSAQDLLFQTGKRTKHALLDGVPNAHAILILLLSNPMLTVDCLCDTPPDCLSYLNAEFGGRVFIGQNRDRYDLLHIDRPNPAESLDRWGPLLAQGADCLIVRWNKKILAHDRLIWVESTPLTLRAKYRHDSPYIPENDLPSAPNN